MKTPAKLNFYLVDDHAIMREGLKMILTAQEGNLVVGEAGDGAVALEEIDRLKPDVLLLDISLPTVSGIEITRKVRKYHPDIKIIILSRHDNEEYLAQLLKYGIHGFVLKDEAGDDLLRAVGALRKGERYLSPRLANHLMNNFESGAPISASNQFSLLTNREREILKLIAEGNSNNEVAKLLWISPQTVRVHRQNMMSKLKVHKVADLVKYAIKEGMIEP